MPRLSKRLWKAALVGGRGGGGGAGGGRREAPHISRKNKEGRRSEKKLQRSTMGDTPKRKENYNGAQWGIRRRERTVEATCSTDGSLSPHILPSNDDKAVVRRRTGAIVP